MKKRIKEIRLQRKLTLLEVANHLGISEATAQRYESGEIKNLKYDTIVALAELLNVSPAYLMGWCDNPSPTPSSVPQVPDLTSSEIQIVKKLHKLDNDDQLKVEGMIDSYLMDPKYKEKEKLA